MIINGKDWKTIWLREDGRSVGIIDQTKLPHDFTTCVLQNLEDTAKAIRNMLVRGAPLIGVSGAYGLMLAIQEDPSDAAIKYAKNYLSSTRPTAVNLAWALERVSQKVLNLPERNRGDAARAEAALIADEDISICKAIGEHGLRIFEEISASKIRGVEEPINVLTHCNAGWLATVDWGTALAPIYKANRAGMKIHVWVDETRPRNQGASLTAFELSCEGVPNTVIVDNAGGYLMQMGKVDAVIVGTDRTTRSGDVCNKIGTYLKALAAKDNSVPFYVALPKSTLDWALSDGIAEIPIEVRSEKEVSTIQGELVNGSKANQIVNINLIPESSKSFNPAFDVTQARLITGFITEIGILEPSEESLRRLL